VPVRKLPELFDAQFDGVVVVAVWFDSVVEGVDMWFSDDQSKDMPKFRMKMKVNHGDDIAVFAIFDKDVQNLAMETCPVLLSMGESCSLYPDEMECFYGDAYIYKVKKRDDADFDDLSSFQVTSLCNE
ncbi:hypothetical protein A2U01_0045761, partial [Trifolium medium]|nr:hypothetical protein [Trifolium medium]